MWAKVYLYTEFPVKADGTGQWRNKTSDSTSLCGFAGPTVNLGIRTYDEKVRAYFDTATVKTTIEFKAPGRADEMLDIYVRVRRIGNTSITLETEIYRDGTDELLTRIETVSVDFDASAGRARPVTDDVRTLVTHFEESGEVLPIERFPELLPGTGS